MSKAVVRFNGAAGLVLEFNAVAGKPYRVEVTEAVGLIQWRTLAGLAPRTFRSRCANPDRSGRARSVFSVVSHTSSRKSKATGKAGGLKVGAAQCRRGLSRLNRVSGGCPHPPVRSCFFLLFPCNGPKEPKLSSRLGHYNIMKKCSCVALVILFFFWAITSNALGNNGSLDGGFLAEVPGGVLATIVQEDGRILIEGGFSSINGVERYRVARLNPDGSLDLASDAGAGGREGAVWAIAVQPNRQILMAGDFSRVNGAIKFGIVRLNPDGILDKDFSTGSGPSGGSVHSIAVQTDGKILIAGGFTKVDGTNRNRIARLNTDGSLDATFLSVGSGSVQQQLKTLGDFPTEGHSA